MTYCSTLAKPLLKKIKAGKTLDEIGAELCGDSIKNPRQKAIRLVRELLGEETLIQYAETLKYDTGKAELSRKRKAAPQRKISTTTDSGSDSQEHAPRHQPSRTESKQEQEPHPVPAPILEAVRQLTAIYPIQEIKNALTLIESDNKKAV